MSTACWRRTTRFGRTKTPARLARFMSLGGYQLPVQDGTTSVATSTVRRTPNAGGA